MGSITIRNLGDNLKSCSRIQAAAHGRSMDDEARDIPRPYEVKRLGIDVDMCNDRE
jgi:plasmid stability protein